MEPCVDDHGRLSAVPIVQIVWRKLVIPFQLAGVRLQRQYGRGVKIIALPLISVVGWIRVADAPKQRASFIVISSRHPGRAASAELG